MARQFSGRREDTHVVDMEVEAGQIVDYCHRLIEVLATIQPDPIAAELVRQALESYGRNRDQSERVIDAMRKYLSKHNPVSAELRGTFTAV